MTRDDDGFLEKGRKRYEAGEKSALLNCLCRCLWDDIPVPVWLKEEFCDACYSAATYEIASWDEVFGPVRKKYKRLHAARRDAESGHLLFERINSRNNAGEPLDELFREVGKDFKMGSTAAKTLYYKIKNNLPGRFKKTRKVSGKILKQKSR